MKASLLLLLFLCSSVRADDLIVSVTEKVKPRATTPFRINAQTLHPTRTKASDAQVLPEIHTYTIVNGQLSTAEHGLTKATELLFQATVHGADFVVLRDEYNSWLGPMNLLLSLGGHPVQVSKIAIVKVASARLVARKELIRKEASYHWGATISK